MFHDWLSGWRDVLKTSPGNDVLAGLTVAAVALPLNVALAVACGLPPIAGLVAGAIGGGIAGFFGGAKLQVTGPAAALSVMVLDIAGRFGATGVAAATVFVGVVSLGLAAARAGKLMNRVPESVLAGFTTGVGLKLLDGQLPELLGFNYRVSELSQMMHRPTWLHEVSWLAVVCGLFVALLVTTTAHFKRFPAAIIGISLVTLVSVYVGFDIERVGSLPSSFPPPKVPLVADDQWLELLIAVLPLSLLAGVESLLSARAIDRMSKTKTPHNSNLELFGQGLANLVTGFFQGMPVTGVVVRSSVNYQSGAKTRLSAILHAGLLALAVMWLSTEIGQVPLAALAGLLLVIGVRLIEMKTLIELAKNEKIEALAFLVTAVGTVSGHLMLGIVAGIALHALNHWLHRHEDAENEELKRDDVKGIRAVLGPERAKAREAQPYAGTSEAAAWLRHIRDQALKAKSAFVHPQASVIGRVVLGRDVHVAANASVRADEGTPFFIGDHTNLQDGVVLHALKDRQVQVAGEGWAVYIGRNVSIAHDALVHGPCYVGDDTFIGFKSIVHDSIVGANCFIGHGALVVGVEIPDGRHVPHGKIVDSADVVASLPMAGEAHQHFNDDVVEVNRGLAQAYQQLESSLRTPVVNEEEAEDREPIPAWDQRWSPHLDKERF
ncbi:MAG: hypothetical protein IPJ65_40225 [Archangiaceae bacterium]|nr:hypothetical protein [Archangiaceae bacterium]